MLQITFLQYFKDIKPGGCFAPPPTDVTGGGRTTTLLKVLKVLSNVICAQDILIYFRLHCLLYIFNNGVAASKANLLKKALMQITQRVT